MNYEVKYKDAIERLKEAVRDNRCSVYFLTEIFPELKELNDETVREALIDGFKAYEYPDREWDYGITPNDAIAWLEKQKPIEGSKDDIRIIDCLIREQEKSLEEVRNDKYGHSEIISDLKERYRERIALLNSLKQRITKQDLNYDTRSIRLF